MPCKVLMLTNMYPEPEWPAWGSFIKTQIDSLSEQGIEVDVMVIKGYRSKLEYVRAIPQLRRRCKHHDYDLIHAHYGLSGLVARTQFRLPILVSFCGDDLLGHANVEGRLRPQSLPLTLLQRALARVVDRVIVKSKAMAALIPAANPQVIPNGVDMSRFRPLDKAYCRAQLGVAPDATFLLFPYGPDRPRKNFRLFESTIEALRKRHGIAAQAMVVDDVANEQIPLYMNAADAMVLTSYWEGSPNAVKEAMACNTPVVSVDVGDVRELIAGRPGYEVCNFDEDELADALNRVLLTPEKTGIRSQMEWLSTAAIARRIADIYVSIVSSQAHD